VTVFAISTGMAILAWIGLALGLVIALLVVQLFNRVVRPLLEIRRYADDILQAGVAIATNLDGVEELERTRELATAVPDLAGAYLQKLQGASQ
jgi:type II secretory pathway component PulM